MNKPDLQHKKEQKKSVVKLDQTERVSLLKAFFSKYQSELIKGVTLSNTKSSIVSESKEYLPILGQMIRNGQLVGFPTETVYGLGSDATNEAALLQIYRVKRRPLTDPIIVHVLDQQQALKLVHPQSQLQLKLFEKLTTKYWPGPLTVILKANLEVLPKVVTAQTGFVGIRSPKCKFARMLISESERPIGAPSANLFSHVSPTSAVHVLNDFYDQQITVVDGERCEYGVQSTVLKISDNNVEILREGSLSTIKLKQFLHHQFGELVQISIKKRAQREDDNKDMQAPGQFLKHYAPYLPCFSASLQSLENSVSKQVYDQSKECPINFSQSALICFDQSFKALKSQFKYFLSAVQLGETQVANEQQQNEQRFCTAQQKIKMRALYFLLRKAQNLDAKVIIIGWNQPKQGTLWDKIYRSTQGHSAQLL